MSLSTERDIQVISRRATYGFNTWMKWKRPANTIFFLHIVHDNLKRNSFKSSIFQGEGGVTTQWYAQCIQLSRYEPVGKDTGLTSLTVLPRGITGYRRIQYWGREGLKQTPSRFMKSCRISSGVVRHRPKCKLYLELFHEVS